MTRMGLRNLVCVISSGSTTEASSSERSCGSEQAEGDQEYSPSSEGAAAAAAAAAAAPSLSSKCMNSSSSRESWHGGGHDHHGRASAAATVAHEPVSPASGGTHMFSCFHACAINLIAHHPVMGSSAIGSQRKGSPGTSTGDHHHHHHGTGGTPSGLGPRSRSFMNGAGEHTSGDDPISPVVTCIGQVRVKQTKAAKTAMESVEAENKGPKKGRLQRSTLNRMPDSPRLSRWRHFLGAKATVSYPSSQRPGPEHDFEIDLNRFSTTCSSLVKTAPSLEDITTCQARSGSFLAKSLMLLQLDCDESTTQNSSQKAPTLEAFQKALEVNNAIKVDLPKVGLPTKSSCDQEPLWKRRCGSKPLTLDLQKRSLSAPPSLN